MKRRNGGRLMKRRTIEINKMIKRTVYFCQRIILIFHYTNKAVANFILKSINEFLYKEYANSLKSQLESRI